MFRHALQLYVYFDLSRLSSEATATWFYLKQFISCEMLLMCFTALHFIVWIFSLSFSIIPRFFLSQSVFCCFNKLFSWYLPLRSGLEFACKSREYAIRENYSDSIENLMCIVKSINENIFQYSYKRCDFLSFKSAFCQCERRHSRCSVKWSFRRR